MFNQITPKLLKMYHFTWICLEQSMTSYHFKIRENINLTSITAWLTSQMLPNWTHFHRCLSGHDLNDFMWFGASRSDWIQVIVSTEDQKESLAYDFKLHHIISGLLPTFDGFQGYCVWLGSRNGELRFDLELRRSTPFPTFVGEAKRPT